MKGLRVLLLLGIVGAVAACHRNDDKKYDAPGPFDPVARQVSGLFLDGATDAPITDPIHVSILGANGEPSTVALDDAGQPRTEYTVRTGVLSFQVSKTAMLPVDLVVVSRADGYTAGSARLHIAQGGTQTFTTRLTNLQLPPDGVQTAIADAGTANTSGRIAAPIVLETPADTIGGAVQLSVPANTVITTADGTPLSGALEATAAYYAPSADSALEAFPGGLDVQLPASGAGTESATFLSAGFAAVEIRDATGKMAASFDQPFGLKVAVPEGTINPDTGVAVAEGDVIPFWSYDEATGLWRSEGDVTLGAPANGVLNGVAQVRHMSYFNLDWKRSICPTAKQITITGNPQNVGLTIAIRAVDGGFTRFLNVAGPGMSPVILSNAPSFRVNMWAYLNGQEVARVINQELCGTGSITMPVTLPAVQPASLQAVVTRACVQDASKYSAVGSATVVVTPRNLVGATDVDGKATFQGLTSGEQVTVSAYTLDGIQLNPRSLTLRAGANVVEFVQLVRCLGDGEVTGVTGGTGWN